MAIGSRCRQAQSIDQSAMRLGSPTRAVICHTHNPDSDRIDLANSYSPRSNDENITFIIGDLHLNDRGFHLNNRGLLPCDDRSSWLAENIEMPLLVHKNRGRTSNFGGDFFEMIISAANPSVRVCGVTRNANPSLLL